MYYNTCPIIIQKCTILANDAATRMPGYQPVISNVLKITFWHDFCKNVNGSR